MKVEFNQGKNETEVWQSYNTYYESWTQFY